MNVSKSKLGSMLAALASVIKVFIPQHDADVDKGLELLEKIMTIFQFGGGGVAAWGFRDILGRILHAIAVVPAILLALAFSSQANAQLIVAPTMGLAVFMEDGSSKRVGEVLGEIAYQFPWSQNWRGELATVYGAQVDQSDFGGIGLRTYAVRGNVYPGFGLFGFVVGDEADLVDETSVLFGGELLLAIPYDGNNDDDTITVYAGLYDSIVGDDLKMARLGVRLSIN